MGHGAARELGGKVEVPDLSPEHNSRLKGALLKVDEVDDRFKTSRDEERHAQLSKTWIHVVEDIHDSLGKLARVLYRDHQMNADMGVQGGGQAASPWMEETTSDVFKRCCFTLDEGRIRSYTGDHTLGFCEIEELSYEWVEQMVVEWIAVTVEDLGSTALAR